MDIMWSFLFGKGVTEQSQYDIIAAQTAYENKMGGVLFT